MGYFLICHRGALGDFILTWPALYSLKAVLQGYKFFGIGKKEYMRLAQEFGLIDSFIDMESVKLLDFFSGIKIPSEIPSVEGAVMWLKDGEKIASLLKKDAIFPVLSINPFPLKKIHTAYYHCISIKPYFPIMIPKNLYECFPEIKIKPKFAFIHPGSGSESKNCQLKFYCSIAEYLKNKGYNVAFLLGPVEQEKEIEHELLDAYIVEKPENVSRLAHVLMNSVIYIGNDSGVTHLSAFLGIPTIALYKSTDPNIWGAIGKKVFKINVEDENNALNAVYSCIDFLCKDIKYL
ncbi:MAG: glycosyltransferase family 9 protein [Desulfobacterales bacterium]|nr:glycosyltransferase family 9 protein [Desulfobacterales bacterium]